MPELKITDTHSLYLAQARVDIAHRAGIPARSGTKRVAETAIQLLAECMAERDAYRARCSVMPSDLGPEHTAARLLSYALANGWSELRRGEYYVHIARDHRRLGVLTNLADGGAMCGFCERHAAASGLAPLDVLDAIGKMP